MDEGEFISLIQPRQRTWKPVVLRKPRSEDMRVVVEAELQDKRQLCDLSSRQLSIRIDAAIKGLEGFNAAANRLIKSLVR